VSTSLGSRRVASALACAALVIVAACSGGGGSKAASTSSSASGGAFGSAGGGGDAVGAAYVPTGPLVADNGFRPEKDGFGFENYGASANKDMSPVEVRRIFGDAVCATIQDGNCLLTPPAQQWMDQSNQIMSGGHCYGFSVAALQMFDGKVKQTPFGADTTVALPLPNNDPLQREIAYSFIHQMFDTVQGAKVSGTPSQILDKLIETLKAPKGTAELYTVAFFNRQGGGGHAVTAYGVEDKGDNKFAILIYDNNYPNVTRAIQLDKTAETWSYQAATNPSEPSSLYEGDATTKSLFLYPTSPGITQQPCPFCAPGGTGTALGSGTGAQPVALRSTTQAPAAADLYNEVALEGSPGNHGHLVITDDQGHRAGIIDGKPVAEIPGVRTVTSFAASVWDEAEEPVYRIPVSVKFTISIDGSALKTADVTNVLMTGPGYDLAVDGIMLDPGQVDTLQLSPDGTHLSYTTTKSESPAIAIGVDGAGADHAFVLKGVDVQGGGTINASIDSAAGTLTLSTSGTTTAGQYAMVMDLFTPTSEQVFVHDNIVLNPGDTATLGFGEWKKDGDTISLTIAGPNGSPNTIQLSDEGN
jgi:hypothetical protein